MIFRAGPHHYDKCRVIWPQLIAPTLAPSLPTTQNITNDEELSENWPGDRLMETWTEERRGNNLGFSVVLRKLVLINSLRLPRRRVVTLFLL